MLRCLFKYKELALLPECQNSADSTGASGRSAVTADNHKYM